MTADFGPRLASGVVLAAFALAALAAGGDIFVLFWTLAGMAVFWEWQTIVGGPARRARLCVGWLALAAVGWFVSVTTIDRAMLCLIASAVVLAALGGPGFRIWSAFGVIYAGALVVAIGSLRLSLDGFYAIFWLFAVVWGADTAAYAGGRSIGGPKLWPRVSPGKTWSGFLIGVVGGALFGVGTLAVAGGISRGSWPWLLGMGLCAAVVSQAGDLFESAVKRRFDVKDASHLIPGHGGVMDRLDGFIAAGVLVALVGGLRSGPLELAIGALRW